MALLRASRRLLLIAGVPLALAVAGCGATGGDRTIGAATPQLSLYERLAAKPATVAVVDDFIGSVAADARINGRFAGANIPRLKASLVDQVCEAAGGPCTYRGPDMRSAHAGMGITDAEFDALVEDLVRSLDRFAVPAREQDELLGALGGMRGDIVGM